MAEIENEQTQTTTPNAKIKKGLTNRELLEKFIKRQELLIKKFDVLIEDSGENKTKDKWDVISSLSGLFTFLSSIVIALVGIYFTGAYKKQDVRITEAQTVEKFLPFLNSQSIETRKGALLAVYGLQNYELATRLAASYAAPDNIEACEAILKSATGEAREQLIDALVDALKTRAENESSDNYSRVDRQELIRNYNRIFELTNDASILEKRGKWYLASIYTGRGNMYRDLKSYDKASAEYQKSLQIYPDFPWTFDNIGIAYGLQNNFELSIQNITKAIELAPNAGQYYADLGVTYSKKADYENNTYTKKADYENAETQFTKAIKKEPTNIEIHFRRAYFYLDNEMLDKAESAFEDIYHLSQGGPNQNQTEALYQLRKLNPKYSQGKIQERDMQTEDLPPVPERDMQSKDLPSIPESTPRHSPSSKRDRMP